MKLKQLLKHPLALCEHIILVIIALAFLIFDWTVRKFNPKDKNERPYS